MFRLGSRLAHFGSKFGSALRDCLTAAFVDDQPWLEPGDVEEQWRETGSDDTRLRDAVLDLYYAAHWTADRPCDADALWRSVRDAAGFEPGSSTACLGARRAPMPFEQAGGVGPAGLIDLPGEETPTLRAVYQFYREHWLNEERRIAAFEKRVNELLAANSTEVERRRTAERELRALRDRLAGFFGARQAAEWQL